MNFFTSGLIIISLLILTVIIGAGCKTFFSERKPPVKVKIADEQTNKSKLVGNYSANSA